MKIIKVLFWVLFITMAISGCDDGKTTSPSTKETVYLNPEDVQIFRAGITNSGLMHDDSWVITNMNPSDDQYDESVNIKDTAEKECQFLTDAESPGSYELSFTRRDYISPYPIYYLWDPPGDGTDSVVYVSKITKKWDIVVCGIEVLPEKNITVLPGESQVYTATAYPTGDFNYAWYLDEVKVADGDSYTFSPTPDQCGLHHLMVKAKVEGGTYAYNRQITVPLAKLEAVDGSYLDFKADFLPCDGGYVFVSSTRSTTLPGTPPHGGTDGYVYKIDDQGTVIWRTLTGGSGSDYLTTIKPVLGGGFIAAGFSTSNDIPETVYNGSLDGYLVRLDSQGNILWQKLYGSTGDDYVRAILQTKEGAFITTGTHVRADLKVY